MFLSKPRVQYRTMTFEEKVAAICEVEKGCEEEGTDSKRFSNSARHIIYISKIKEEILNIMTNENWKDRKRARGPKNPEVDKCMLKWFKQAWDKKIPLRGP